MVANSGANGADDGGNGSLPPIIEAWTSEMLKDYKPHRPRNRQDGGDCTIAFGRNTKKSLTPVPRSSAANTPKNPLLVVSSSGNVPILQRGRRSRVSMKASDKSADDTATSVASGATGALSDASSSLTRRLLLSGQDAKHIGRQMFTSTTSGNGPEELAKAQEKRRRQLSYAQEIRHAASSGSNSSVSLQIDSITRVVVQNFRKLINCERCALFLMDDKRDQLYFKPVGDPSGGGRQVQVIRFSASKGVAGWVATNRRMLNIKNAYVDDRFNQEIDKQTNFRTRTILCVPVLDSSGTRVLGVIQMVNKLLEDGKAKQKKAKNTKSDNTHHGYLEVYETFSTDDEETLQKCAHQVSTSLEEVLTPDGPRSTDTIDKSEQNSVDAHNDGGSGSQVEDETGEDTDEISESSSDDSTSSSSESEESESEAVGVLKTCTSPSTPLPTIELASPSDGRRRSSAARRRSSVASLVQFVSAAHSIQKAGGGDNEANVSKNQNAADEVGISEALQRFQFRNASGRQISNRRGSLLAENPEFLAAETKRKRMEEYNERRMSTGNGQV